MKRNEIALILVVVGIVVFLTYSIVNTLFGSTVLTPVKVKEAKTISAELQHLPDARVFNKDAINPSVIVTIGNQANQQPF